MSRNRRKIIKKRKVIYAADQNKEASRPGNNGGPPSRIFNSYFGCGGVGCPASTAVTELGSLSAFASISEICHIWVSDRL